MRLQRFSILGFKAGYKRDDPERITFGIVTPMVRARRVKPVQDSRLAWGLGKGFW